MLSKKELQEKIERWDGVNKYIVRKAKFDLRELESKEKQPQVKEPIKSGKKPSKKNLLGIVKDVIEDLADDGKLNKSNRKKRKK